MGEIAEMMLDGTLCEGCGEYLDGGGMGFPMRCGGCGGGDDAAPAPPAPSKAKRRRARAERTRQHAGELRSIVEAVRPLLKLLAKDDPAMKALHIRTAQVMGRIDHG